MSAVIHLAARVLRNGLPGLVALLLGIALLEFVQAILFNEFGGVRELNAMVDLIPPVLQAFVRTRSEFLALSGLPGYLALGFTYPLYLLLAAAAVIGFAANSLAGEMDRGTIQAPLSRAISRPAVYLSRMLGMALICVLLALTGPVGMTFGILYARPEGEEEHHHPGGRWRSGNVCRSARLRPPRSPRLRQALISRRQSATSKWSDGGSVLGDCPAMYPGYTPVPAGFAAGVGSRRCLNGSTV